MIQNKNYPVFLLCVLCTVNIIFLINWIIHMYYVFDLCFVYHILLVLGSEPDSGLGMGV